MCCVVVYACLPAVACGVRVYTLCVYMYVHSMYIYSLSAHFPFESCAVTHCYLCRYRQHFFSVLSDGIEFTPAKRNIYYAYGSSHTQFHYLRCKIITVYSINFALDFCCRSLPSLSCSIIFNTPTDQKQNSTAMFARLLFCRGNKRNITPIIVNVYLNTWRWQ